MKENDVYYKADENYSIRIIQKINGDMLDVMTLYLLYKNMTFRIVYKIINIDEMEGYVKIENVHRTWLQNFISKIFIYDTYF